jgi:predicted RNase H-like HicB family nuclease
LVRPDKAIAVIVYTRRHDRVIHGSIFRMTRGWPSLIKCGKRSEPSPVWRQNVVLKNDRYTYRVTWSEEDNEHVGLCAEFPSLSWLAPTPEAALKGIRKIVAEVVADLQANGEPVPTPLATKPYSGKFMVRVHLRSTGVWRWRQQRQVSV